MPLPGVRVYQAAKMKFPFDYDIFLLTDYHILPEEELDSSIWVSRGSRRAQAFVVCRAVGVVERSCGGLQD